MRGRHDQPAFDQAPPRHAGSAPDERPAPSRGAEALAAHVEVLDVRTVLAESV
jgi:hypothetical protein